VEPIAPGKTLSKMLEEGEIDAIYAPRAPSTLHTDPEKVQRLFPDYAAVEREYYCKTKIFPIMHTIVIRRELYEKNPWVAQSLYKAFMAAKREAYQDLHEVAALKVMLPWLGPHVEDTEKLMGRDFWPYGLADNERALDTFLRYSWEQGLSKRRLTPRELFAPETLEAFKI
jgi:4,5-dihydroxyphthalate decarboxylase